MLIKLCIYQLQQKIRKNSQSFGSQ